ncbi:MAG: glycoside hydrolase family 88 protein, partial [Sedimentisphaerales bacterium]|nr:glycoside hydrolase family 88 protein [Sedimentisphaerales bacterium]
MKKNLQTESSLRNLLLSSVIILFSAANLFADSPKVRPASEMTGPYIDWMKKVADWQLSQSSWDDDRDWKYGALFAGMMAAYEATKDEEYLNKSRQWANYYNYEMSSDSWHADNHACAQTYLELYLLDEQDTARYTHSKYVNDQMVADPSHFNCDVAGGSEVWWWCDALFMHPPVHLRLSRILGDSGYTNLMHMMWAETQDCLYDTDDHLFYRDITYFGDEIGGEKVFWSRGNGWVVGGIVRILQYMPLDDPNRPVYETLLQEMAGKLKDIQQPDGYWYSNLLYPEHYDMPETSGTGFFTYGIAWGINNGYLSEATYEPVIADAWAALKAAVHPDGKLGHVQPVGAGPNSSPYDSTAVYGVGAYLLAGSEVQKYYLSQDPSFIDYFETYDDDSELNVAWKDGNTNGTDSEISLGNYGDRFMILEYDNSSSPYDSRVDRTFTTAQNWEVNEFVSLSIL